MKKLAENIWKEYSILKSKFLEKIESEMEKVVKEDERKKDAQRKKEEKFYDEVDFMGF